MATIIDKADIRKGDKIKVTYTHKDAEYTRTGVAQRVDFDCDWQTEDRVYLNLTGGRDNQVIELLERPKSAEEILTERRDNLVAVFVNNADWIKYHNTSVALRGAVDHIISLEDEKEALTK